MLENKRALNQVSGRVILFLSVTALLCVLSGYTEPPQEDEGTGAHIFQLAIVLCVPSILFFLGTADWSRPSHSVRPLAVSVAALVLAFGALYYLEDYRNTRYYGHRAVLEIGTQRG